MHSAIDHDYNPPVLVLPTLCTHCLSDMAPPATAALLCWEHEPIRCYRAKLGQLGRFWANRILQGEEVQRDRALPSKWSGPMGSLCNRQARPANWNNWN